MKIDRIPDTKQQWFKEAKYGLFIHFGLYSILAGEYNGKKTDHISEWIMNTLGIPVEEYEKLEKQRAAVVPAKKNLDTHYSTVEEPFIKRFTAVDKAHTELYVRTKGVKWVEVLNRHTIVCCADNTCDREAAEAKCKGVKIVWVKWEVDNE